MNISWVKGKRILVADDEFGVRQALKWLLKIDEHTVVEAANGREALDIFSREKFDLVITDYSMPEMRGNELAIRIRQLVPEQPVVMITAHPDSISQEQNPVDAMVLKPFEFTELRQTIARLLVKPRLAA